MHYYTGKSLMNTLARAVKQLDALPSKQKRAEVAGRGQSTTSCNAARRVKMSYDNDVTVANLTAQWRIQEGGNTGHIPPPRAVKRSSLGPRAGCSYAH